MPVSGTVFGNGALFQLPIECSYKGFELLQWCVEIAAQGWEADEWQSGYLLVAHMADPNRFSIEGQ